MSSSYFKLKALLTCGPNIQAEDDVLDPHNEEHQTYNNEEDEVPDIWIFQWGWCILEQKIHDVDYILTNLLSLVYHSCYAHNINCVLIILYHTLGRTDIPYHHSFPSEPIWKSNNGQPITAYF